MLIEMVIVSQTEARKGEVLKALIQASLVKFDSFRENGQRQVTGVIVYSLAVCCCCLDVSHRSIRPISLLKVELTFGQIAVHCILANCSKYYITSQFID